jgi:hypothetical protein
MKTVTQISALFHDFEAPHDDNHVDGHVGFKGCSSKRSTALLLATNSSKNNGSRMQLQKKIGIEDEKKMLDEYEKKYGKIVTRRNEEIQEYKFQVDDKVFTVTGKVDGIVEEDSTIIEHKRRIRGLLHRVPFHEKVQCYLYMRMFKMNNVNLIETFGDHMDIHELNFDEATWNRICSRLYMLSDFV